MEAWIAVGIDEGDCREGGRKTRKQFCVEKVFVMPGRTKWDGEEKSHNTAPAWLLHLLLTVPYPISMAKQVAKEEAGTISAGCIFPANTGLES